MNKIKIPELSPQEIAYIKSFVIHIDKEIIVFNKPSGLASQGGSGLMQDLDHLLWVFATSKGRKPKLVHRLDRETSGVIITAQTKPMAAILSQKFAEKSAQKTYFAIVSGDVKKGIKSIDFPLKRGKINGIDMAIIAGKNDENGQSAITKYELIKGNGKISYIKLMPLTGRMHQLRAHLSHIGHPILGDMKYGGLLSIENIKVPRLMLHAQELKIPMDDNKEFNFTAPLPNDFNIFMEKAELI